MTSLQVQQSTKTEATVNWARIFPGQATNTYCNSMLFMKQLTIVGVSMITRYRNVLPDDCYTSDQLGGVNIKVLKEKRDHELAWFISNALTGAFDAFDRKFLLQLVLCLYNEECRPDNLLEFYSFEYQYHEDGAVSVDVRTGSSDTALHCTMDDVKKSTIDLIRTCFVSMPMDGNSKLPEKLDVSIRVYYTNDAPPDYQAPGFQPASHLADPTHAAGFDRTKLGKVQTPYHSVQLTSSIREEHWGSREAQASENTPEFLTQEQTLCTGKSVPSTGESSTGRLRCVCDQRPRHYDRDTTLLTCSYCHTSQHAVCYGVLPNAARTIKRHCCVECADLELGQPTDPRLLDEPVIKKRVSLAMFREIVHMLSTQQTVSVQQIRDEFSLPVSNVLKLFKSLSSFDVVPNMMNKDIKTQVKIDRKQLNLVINEYFHTREDDLVERLMNESQEMFEEPQPDPIGNILGPMKQVSLQNASAIGRVIDPEVHSNDNPTMKEYREAIVRINRNAIDLDLSLSGSRATVESAGQKRKAPEMKVGVAEKKAKTMTEKAKMPTKQAKTPTKQAKTPTKKAKTPAKKAKTPTTKTRRA